MKVLDFEAPQEKVYEWEQELEELIANVQVGHRQEPGHYPLIRVHLDSDSAEEKFVEWLKAKMFHRELGKEFKIIPVGPDEYSN